MNKPTCTKDQISVSNAIIKETRDLVVLQEGKSL